MTFGKKKLGEVCKIISGNSIPVKRKEKFFAGVEGIPYVATKDISYDGRIDYQNGICIPNKFIKDFKVSPVGATLVCAEGGSAGKKIAFSYKNCCYVNKLFSIQPGESFIPKFIYYFCLSNEFKSQFKDAKHGLIGGVSLSKIKDFTITSYPISEQKRTVTKLDKAFEEIDKAIKSVERKEIEFEKLKNSTINDLISLNNESYQSFRLKDVCIIKPPKSEAKEKLNENTEVSFMGMNMLGINQLESSSEDFRKLSSVYNGYTYFAENDVLLAKITPCFENGKLGIAKRLKNGVGFGSSEFIVFRCKENLSPQYLYYYLNQKNFRDEGKKNMTGAVGHKRVSKEFIENSIIKIPSLQKQKIVISKLEKINNEINNIKNSLEKSCKNHKALKSSLLRQELQQENVA